MMPPGRVGPSRPFILLLLLLAADTAGAATRTWTGLGVNHNWTTAGNWDVGPIAGDDLVFPAGVPIASKNTTNDFPPLTLFNSITYDDGGYRVLLFSNPIALGPGGIAATFTSGTTTISTNIALTADVTFSVPAIGAEILLDGGISGAHGISGAYGITKSGSGTVRFAAANTYGGTTTIDSGTLLLQNRSSPGLGDGTPATGTVVNGGVLFFYGAQGTSPGPNEHLRLNGATFGTTDDGSWNGPIVIENTSTITTNGIFEQPFIIRGPISGPGGLVHAGTSLLRLQGMNTYLGGTTNRGGKLLIETSQPGIPVAVDGGILAGTSATNIGPVSVGPAGTVNPGINTGETGTMTVNGSLAFSAGSTFEVDVKSLTDFDHVAVNGTVSLSDATLRVNMAFAGSVGDSFTIITNDGIDAVVGTFADLPEGSVFPVRVSPSTSYLFRVSYVGGTGNDVTITVEGTPALSFFTLTPCRLVDTRRSPGPLGGPSLSAGEDRAFSAVNACDIPGGAYSISVNVTVTEPTGDGYLILYPSGSARPLSSSINFRGGQTRANNAIVRLSAGGALSVFYGGVGTVQVIIDVNGYFH